MTISRKPTGSGPQLGCMGCVLSGCAILAVFILGLTVVPYEFRENQQNVATKSAQTIGFALFRYASDHGGYYPQGRTSTEVFQHLIDENYVRDPSLFYVRMPGKSAPQSAQLKSQNVSWDVTWCVDPTSPDRMPLVFLTGYKIDYRANASAVPVVSPSDRTWWEWWNNQHVLAPFMIVYYKDNTIKLLKIEKDGAVLHFIPDHFKPGKKTFLQLTPDASFSDTTST